MSEEQSPRTTSSADEDRPRVPPPGRWATAMDEIIEEAMRRGDFDNLRGKGRPLKLRQNIYGADTELAHQLLKNNDYTLPWIAERNKTLARVETLRVEVGRQWQRYRSEYSLAQSETVRLALAVGWREIVAGWQTRIEGLNKEIAEANLKQPEAGLEILKLTLRGELARAGAVERLESLRAG